MSDLDLVLPDASTWIDHLADRPTLQVQTLDSQIGLGAVVVGDLVLMEVVRGIRHEDRLQRVLALFASFRLVNMVERGTALRAARHYRYLRSLGITVRSTIDCLIATYCIDHDLPLLHADRDFDAFRDHLGLRVVEP